MLPTERSILMRVSVLLATAAIAVAVVGGVAASSVATHNGSDPNVITACVKRDGKLRVVADASRCRHRERVLTWSVGSNGGEGPPGPAGPPGPTGPPGPPGAQGAT